MTALKERERQVQEKIWRGIYIENGGNRGTEITGSKRRFRSIRESSGKRT